MSKVPAAGWSDLRLASAAMFLATFGDGYAIASYPDAEARQAQLAALPTPSRNAGAARSAGIDTWCELHGHPLPIDPIDFGSAVAGAVTESGSDQQLQALISIGLAADMRSLRRAEQPDRDGYAVASKDAADGFESWMTAYRSVLANLAICDDRVILDAFRDETRPLVIRELTRIRHRIWKRLSDGAEAEAVLATLLTLLILRCIYLLTTIADREDAARLHLTPLDEFDWVFEAYGLPAWLDDARARVPPDAD